MSWVGGGGRDEDADGGDVRSQDGGEGSHGGDWEVDIKEGGWES